VPECLKCGKPGQYVFHVLEVRTLHVRSISGEQRVQALGKSLDYAVCETCAAKHLEQIQKPGRRMGKIVVPFFLVLVLGLVLLTMLRTTDGNAVQRLIGPAALTCGVLGLASTLRDDIRRRKEFSVLTEEEALARAAWECLLDSAPKKAGDSDLTYIPVNPKTLDMKNGDLMIRYRLLPQIAQQAYECLHRGWANGM